MSSALRKNFIPEVFSFFDYREFLLELFRNIKVNQTNYSYRKLSSDFGFSNSYLGTVLAHRRNLSVASAEIIIKKLKFDKLETYYFRLMIKMNNTKDETKKLKLKSEMDDYRTPTQSLSLTQEFEPFIDNRMSHLIVLMIRAYGKQFKADPLWIIRRITVKATAAEINSAMDSLVRMGIVYKEDEEWKIRFNNLVGINSVEPKVLQRMYQGYLNETIKALDLPAEQRELGHISICIDCNRFEELKHKIQEIQKELRIWIREGNRSDEEKMIISLNLGMFPLTDPAV